MLQEVKRFSGHTKRPSLVAVATRTGRLISTSDDRHIRIWNLNTGEPLSVVDDMDPGTHQPVMEWALLPCGELLVTGVADFTTKVYSTSTAERLHRLTRLKKNAYNPHEMFRVSSDGKQLASLMSRRIDIISTEDWSVVHTMKGHTSRISEMAFSPNGSFLATSGGKQLRYWNTESGEEIRTVLGHKKLVNGCCFLPDGKGVITWSDDKTVCCWSFPGGEQIWSYEDHIDGVCNLRMSPSGGIMASRHILPASDWRYPGNGRLHLWSRTSRQTITAFDVGYFGTNEFSPCGQWLAVATANKEVLLIEVDTGTIKHELPQSEVVGFLPDSSGIITADGNDIVLWKLP
jgi:WD40 repeat protein